MLHHTYNVITQGFNIPLELSYFELNFLKGVLFADETLISLNAFHCGVARGKICSNLLRFFIIIFSLAIFAITQISDKYIKWCRLIGGITLFILGISLML